MRELNDMEIEDVYARRGLEMGGDDASEKWFTFEHSGQWREVQRQFLGAVGSHGMCILVKRSLLANYQYRPERIDGLVIRLPVACGYSTSDVRSL